MDVDLNRKTVTHLDVNFIIITRGNDNWCIIVISIIKEGGENYVKCIRGRNWIYIINYIKKYKFNWVKQFLKKKHIDSYHFKLKGWTIVPYWLGTYRTGHKVKLNSKNNNER